MKNLSFVFAFALLFSFSASAEAFRCMSCKDRPMVDSVKHTLTDGRRIWVCCQVCFVGFTAHLSSGKIREIK